MKKFMFAFNLCIALLTLVAFITGGVVIITEGYKGNILPTDFYEVTGVTFVMCLLFGCNSFFLCEGEE